MKKRSKFTNLMSGLALGVAILLGSSATALAVPAQSQATPPASSNVSGKQAKPAFEPGSRDAKPTAKLGPTNIINMNGGEKSDATAITQAGNVANIDFQAPLNYCYRNLVSLPISNTSGSTKYVRVFLYDTNTGTMRDMYLSVPSATYPTYASFYGIDGNYTAYLYVWNGSSYVYDEYKSNKNTCSVSVSRVYNAGGWVQLKIQNVGTAYASQVSSELAPYPAYGTYTGTHYDYPAAGGAALYRWFYVGTSPYGITSYTSGSWNSPYFFYGDL